MTGAFDDRVDVWVMSFADTSPRTVELVRKHFEIDEALAKRVVFSAPTVVKRNLAPVQAIKFRRAFEQANAAVEIVPTGAMPPRQRTPVASLRPSLPTPGDASIGPGAAVSSPAPVWVAPSNLAAPAAEELPLPDLDLGPMSPPGAASAGSSSPQVGAPRLASRPAAAPARHVSARPALAAPTSAHEGGLHGPGSAPSPSAGAASEGGPSLGGRALSMLSRSARRFLARTAIGLVISLGAFIWYSFADDDEVPAYQDVDSICEEELSQPHAEARRWLQSPTHAMTGLRDPSAAIGLVNQLYTAGAVDVQVTDIFRLGLTHMSSTLVVELPAENREPILDLAARAVAFDGEHIPIAPDGYVELGERYLRIDFGELGGDGPAEGEWVDE